MSAREIYGPLLAIDAAPTFCHGRQVESGWAL
jgi:hypothetical protein